MQLSSALLPCLQEMNVPQPEFLVFSSICISSRLHMRKSSVSLQLWQDSALHLTEATCKADVRQDIPRGLK